jgi:2-dehydropantoate 2-reductase
MVARGGRAAQIAHDGLRVHGLGRVPVRVASVDDTRGLREADVLIVATKAIGTAAALSRLRDAQFGMAMSVQNGVRKTELVAAAFGADKALGAVANISGELQPGGEVLFTRNQGIIIGAVGETSSEGAVNVGRQIDAAGISVSVVNDIYDREWSKFTSWVSLVVLAVTTRKNTWQFLANPPDALLFTGILREIAALAGACGAEIQSDGVFPLEVLCNASDQAAIDALVRIGHDFRARAPDHRVSALQDLQAGRPLEIEETIGYAQYRSRELELDLPLLECYCDLLRAIDRARGLVKGMGDARP